MNSIEIIILVAAILIFLIQRARYLREIEPDLELAWANKITVDKMSQDVDKFWDYYIHVDVKNVSNNRANDMLFKVALKLFPERGRPRFLESKYPLIPGLHETQLRPQRTMQVPIYVGLNYTRGLSEELGKWGKPVTFDACGFHAGIVLEYYSNRDFLLFILVPWSFGRIKYKREIYLEYAFEALQKDGKSTYVARKWDRMGELSEYIQDD
jgi:hypothetical protein